MLGALHTLIIVVVTAYLFSWISYDISSWNKRLVHCVQKKLFFVNHLKSITWQWNKKKPHTPHFWSCQIVLKYLYAPPPSPHINKRILSEWDRQDTPELVYCLHENAMLIWTQIPDYNIVLLLLLFQAIDTVHIYLN